MKKLFYQIIGAIVMTALLVLPISAQQHEHTEHSGKLIHESSVDGYSLAYHLIDMREAMAGMKGHGAHEGQSATHHLMLYITDPSGNAVADATVGFLIEGPNGIDQKVMAMGMGNGYGADVSLKDPGQYTIKAKAVAGKAKLIDEFEYNVSK